ncbi:MAG TPA: hypothetical protein VG842_09260, partial [Sediminibacterium sp.]|nr:hypothetical protein [Sediminibacterium sp.]
MRFIPCIYLLVLITVKAHTQTIGSPLPSNWCQHPLRAAFQKLPEIKVTQSWFRVFRAGKDVIAITEPYNFEEVISYLILGKDKALLFDTGLGV